MSKAPTVPDRVQPVEAAKDSSETILERLNDPTYLPSYAELISLGSDAEEGFHRLVGDRGGYRRFEIFTQEYIAALAELILSERTRRGIAGSFAVLEVGAGDGNLSYFLETELASRQESGVYVICTDSGDLHIAPMVPDGVELMEAGQAVDRFNPDLIVASWMSGSLDLTASFRANESVQSYVLIGPANSSFSGRAWETWGHGEWGTKVAPFRRDGFDKDKVMIAPQLNASSLRTHEMPSGTHIFRRQPQPV